MIICPNCKKKNPDSASVCWACQEPLTAVPGSQGPANPPPPPTPVPIAPPVSAPTAVPVVTPTSAPEPPTTPPLHSALQAPLELLLGRSIDPHEPIGDVASEMSQRVKTLQHSGALPNQPQLLSALQKFVGPVQPGAPAAPVMSALLSSIQKIVPAGNVIPIPSVLATILRPFPQSFMWLVTMLGPLLIGGGVGVPLWQKFFAGDSTKSQQINSKPDDQAKMAEMQAHTNAQIDQVKTEAEAKRKADMEQAQADSKTQLDAARDSMNKEAQQNKLALTKATTAASTAKAEAKRVQDDLNKAGVANTKLVAQNADLNARLEATSRESRSLHDQVGKFSIPRGYVVWRGTGDTMVNITSANHQGLEGAFPNGPCFVVDVFGEHIDPKNSKGAKCSDFTFKVSKKSPTAAYILWRTTP